MDACKYSHVCFLNCKGCPDVDNATPEELKQAKKDLKAYRKRIGLTTH